MSKDHLVVSVLAFIPLRPCSHYTGSLLCGKNIRIVLLFTHNSGDFGAISGAELRRVNLETESSQYRIGFCHSLSQWTVAEVNE